MDIFYSEFFVLVVCSLTGTGTTNASIMSGKVLWKRWSRNDFLYKVYLELLFIIINFLYLILLDGIFSTCLHGGFLCSELGMVSHLFSYTAE